MTTSTTIHSITGRTINCLLFDLGNTLWYRDEQHLPALENAANIQAITMLKQVGLPTPWQSLTDEQAGHILRQAVFDAFHQHISQHPGDEPEGRAIIHQVLQTYTQQEYDQSICNTIFEALGVRMFPSRRLFPDALSTLAALKDRDYTLGIVTNRYWGGQPLREDLQAMGLLDYFSLDTLIASADLHIRKPNPHIFEMALQACSALPDHTAMIGDSLFADIAGAQQLGIFSIWKPFLYSEVATSLADTHHQSIPDYNLQQLHQLKNTTTIPAPTIPYSRPRDHAALDYFLQRTVQPQLIINNLSDLLTYL